MLDKETLKSQKPRTKNQRIASLKDDIKINLLTGKRMRQLSKMENPPDDYQLVEEMLAAPQLTENELLELDIGLFDEIRRACFKANGIDDEDAKKN